jgi:hypothetical protein
MIYELTDTEPFRKLKGWGRLGASYPIHIRKEAPKEERHENLARLPFAL